jgi:signal transduction histidine kinase
VLDRLLGNAVKFTAAGGSVTVRATVDRGRAAIEVEDDGVGISAEEQRGLFERFARGRAARHGETPGAGLGLAIVRTIVEAHGGVVGLRSEEGRGTTILVELPLAP